MTYNYYRGSDVSIIIFRTKPNRHNISFHQALHSTELIVPVLTDGYRRMIRTPPPKWWVKMMNIRHPPEQTHGLLYLTKTTARLSKQPSWNHEICQFFSFQKNSHGGSEKLHSRTKVPIDGPVFPARLNSQEQPPTNPELPPALLLHLLQSSKIIRPKYSYTQ